MLSRRFKKLYDDYRAGFMHWKLVLLARKFAMAVVAIMLDYNPLFQVRSKRVPASSPLCFPRCWPRIANAGMPCVLCALQATLCAVVLYTAYVLQQRFVPFMSLRAFNDATAKIVAARQQAATTARDGGGAADAAAMGSLRKLHGVPSQTRLRGRRRSWFEPDPDAVLQLRSAHLLDRLRLRNASVLVGLVMQRVMEDYNHLESTFLISGMLVLLAGLVFNGGGFRVGSAPHHLLTAAVASIVIGATVTFVVLIAVELYKSFRDADLHAALRAAEAASVESALRSGVRSKQREVSSSRADRLGWGATSRARTAADAAASDGGGGSDTTAPSAVMGASAAGGFAVENPLRQQTRRRAELDDDAGRAGSPVWGDVAGGSDTGPSREASLGRGRGVVALPPPRAPESLGVPARLQRVRAAQRPVLSARAGVDGVAVHREPPSQEH